MNRGTLKIQGAEKIIEKSKNNACIFCQGMLEYSSVKGT